MADPKKAAKTIRPVDGNTVHRICSGQVILSLSTAVKELVENSLDAGATSVEVRLWEHGSQKLEVADDGEGVEEHNYEGLALKHHTSKLREFSDLSSVSSFGFRGEALSSLCALSKSFTVTTKTASDEHGTMLVFNSSGKLVTRNKVARSRGTTVTLEDLFGPLPVRRREFLRHLKREFAKLVHVLQAYCLVSTRVRFTCCNTMGKTSRVVLQTSGHADPGDAIVDLFGPKSFSSLKRLELGPPTPEEVEEYSLKTSGEWEESGISGRGFISTCSHGQGRSSADRQFVFVNSRPCDLPRVNKVINETFHQFNRAQFPFVFLHLRLPSASVDVNVTPDKRQLLLHGEKVLLASLKSSLKRRYEKVPFQCNTSVLESFRIVQNEAPEEDPVEEFSLKSLKREFSSNSDTPSITTKRKKVSTIDRFVKVKSVESSGKKSTVDEVKIIEVSSQEAPQDVKDAHEEEVEVTFDEPVERRPRKTVQVAFSMDSIKQRLKEKPGRNDVEKRHRKFLSDMQNSKAAEHELSKNLKKEDFTRMSVLGQFNLGFIIARLDRDLFIIDQHAADEKHTFEKLQASNVLETQRMLVPQPLELTAASEAILLDNLPLFAAKGFHFDVDPPVSLLKVPHYRNWIFGKEDVEEMIFLLSEGERNCRPSRLSAMFASRACRTSVMIGTALNREDQRRLVRQMADMEHPWNCPHGRPTMRHLVNLDLLI